ncbi:MAG TPA: FAD-binding oxidoreductase [Gemmatimonadaceae bacterium]|nr:FAD-binding oxidoreductase [Gemmatimonadaceae bacterium]
MSASTERIAAGDPRYRAVIDKQFNKRFTARPDYIRLASSTEQVVVAVQDAVDEGRRLVVTSGGHCLEGFVSDPDVRVIVDVSPMKRIYYDRQIRAIAVEAGATVGDTFRVLSDRWGTVIPLGEYPGIGTGGHVAGGAFGFLCRLLGLAADYLYAVEVVTVDNNGRANTVIATCEPNDPNRELWWAHTGGGAGSFGIITRQWFRSRNATGDDPSQLLPRAPQSITTFHAEWNWSELDRASFVRLLTNHGAWAAANSDAESPERSLWSLLIVHRPQIGKIIVRGLSVDGVRAKQQIDSHLAALSEGTNAPAVVNQIDLSWLDFALNPFPDLFTMPPGGVSTKAKDAMLKKPLTDKQLGVVHNYMTRTDCNVMGGMFAFATYGGRVNSIAPDTTAAPQRQSIFDMACNVGWIDPREEVENVRWVREFYRDLFADTGGVPVPNDRYDGTLINHPDVDVADPTWNASGVPWHTMYFQGNYPRLQRAKAQYDPRNVFHHALAIRLP